MTPTPSHSEDRETLCALFDGELQDDAARFAYRRLDHDAGWRETVGRWQLAGDVMRRRASGVAPAGFAARIALALEAEAGAAQAASTGTHGVTAGSTSRRRWIPGAALAASVAVASLFILRPDDEAAVPAASAVSGVARSTGAAPAASDPAPPSTAAGPVVSSAVAAVDPVPAPLPSAAPARPSAGPLMQAVPVPVPERELASVEDAAPVADPFRAPEVDTSATGRPWPRAVLPAYGDRGFTVDYGRPQGASFYPFDPDMGDRSPPVPEAEPAPSR